MRFKMALLLCTRIEALSCAVSSVVIARGHHTRYLRIGVLREAGYPALRAVRSSPAISDGSSVLSSPSLFATAPPSSSSSAV